MQSVLTVATAILVGWAAVLAASTFALRVADRRARERRATLERQWRAPLEDLVLEGHMPPAPSGPERSLIRSVLLKYLTVLRGGEADAVIAYLDASGFVDEAVAGLKNRRPWDRADAAEFLGRIRSRRAVPALVSALDDPSEDVRTVAARSLAAIRDPSTVEALVAALGQPSRWTVSIVAQDLVDMGADAVPALLRMLHSERHATAVAAVQILGEIRDARAADPLVRLLQSSPQLNVRAQAAAALGKLGGAGPCRALESALRDPAWQVRSQAAKALGRIAPPETAPLLGEAIFDGNWWVRVNCAEALAELGTAGWDELRRLLRAPDRYVSDQCRGVMQLYGLAATAEDAGASDGR
jgi:HEAT repeat protein